MGHREHEHWRIAADHDGRGDHGDHAAMFRDRFWVALVLTVPILVWADSLQHWLG